MISQNVVSRSKSMVEQHFFPHGQRLKVLAKTLQTMPFLQLLLHVAGESYEPLQ
jgi:hypothetical protein